MIDENEPQFYFDYEAEKEKQYAGESVNFFQFEESFLLDSYLF